jgi:hypothetical protein
VLRPRRQEKLARGAKDEEHAISAKLNSAIAVVGIDIGKNSFHVVGLDLHGAIVVARLSRNTARQPCRRVAWRPVSARIISAANSDRLVSGHSACVDWLPCRDVRRGGSEWREGATRFPQVTKNPRAPQPE